MDTKIYSFDEHKHNFAVWTAARAVQRGFTTTSKIKQAIENSELRKFAESEIAEDFDVFHRRCAQQLIDEFLKQSINDISYGRAAKIIAIYLKTSVILCSKGVCDKSSIIHPPIDSILLKRMAEDNLQLKAIHKIRWTILNEREYWDLVEKLKVHFGKFDWLLECYWSPELNDRLDE